MLAAMRRVDVVAPRSLVAPALRTVHRVGSLHLVPFEPPPGVGHATFSRAAPEPRPELTEAVDRLADLAALLAVEATGTPRVATGADERAAPEAPSTLAATVAGLVAEAWELDDAALLEQVARLDPVRREAADLTDERVRLTAELARVASYSRLVEGLVGVLGRLPSIRGYESTGIVVNARYRSVVAAIRDELEALTGGRCEVVAADVGRDRVGAVLIYPARQADQVRALLGGRDLEEVSLPDELAGVPFDELGPSLRAAAERLTLERRRTSDQIAALRSRHASEIEALRLVLGDRLGEARALRDAGVSDHLAVISGWVPARRLAELRAALAAELGDRVEVVERAMPGRPAEAPVELENGPLVRAFEPLAAFVVVPRYGSLDPTPLLALTLPAFVGLMVGDAGYGLALLALLVIARRLRPASRAVRAVWPIGVTAALSTIAFGVLFGEWFGDAGHRMLRIEPLWLDRREAVPELLALAVAIGIAQVGIGLVLGVVNAALLHRGRETAGRAALLVTVAGIVVALASLAEIVPAGAAPLAVGGAAIAFVLLVLTMGLTGPIEVVGALGNILSYARLMAIGLASVMLGFVANRLGTLAEGALVGVLVAGLIHALNFALGFFDASIQGVRLHYVEFFTKFVEPGGVRYRPFVSVLAQTIAPRGVGGS